MDRLYISSSELVTDANSGRTTRLPKYYIAIGKPWSALYYGADDTLLGFIRGITQAEHDILRGKPDVMALPEDLDALMTAPQVAAAKSFLESLFIPAGWVNTSLTVREVIKMIGGLFQFNQRWAGITGKSPFKEGLDLDQTFASMSANTKAVVQEVFNSMNVDTSGLTALSMLREILEDFGSQMSIRPLHMGGAII